MAKAKCLQSLLIFLIFLNEATSLRLTYPSLFFLTCLSRNESLTIFSSLKYSSAWKSIIRDFSQVIIFLYKSRSQITCWTSCLASCSVGGTNTSVTAGLSLTLVSPTSVSSSKTSLTFSSSSATSSIPEKSSPCRLKFDIFLFLH